jgi:hypothetical protein
VASAPVSAETVADKPWNAKAAKPAKHQIQPVFFATFARFASGVVFQVLLIRRRHASSAKEGEWTGDG